tara:strand:+ start:568 stop:1296 length:729 start_codon:yes stop_codon:yes gene_type:complete
MSSNNNLLERIEKLEQDLRKLQLDLHIGFRERVENLEASIPQLEKDSRYRDIHTSKMCNNHYDYSLINENRRAKESKMMTSNEIDKHYAFTHSSKADTYKCSDGTFINGMDAIAGCRQVSSLAYTFFYEDYKLMEPQYVDGWLVSLTDSHLVLKDGSISTNVGVSFEGALKCFVHDVKNGSCIWRHDNNTHVLPSQLMSGSKCCAHSAVRVVSSEGEQVVVDWNIGQFTNLDEGNFVFVIPS